MASDETRYTNKIFMAAALPLMKTIATDVPELKKKFEGVNAIYQVSAKVNAEDKEAKAPHHPQVALKCSKAMTFSAKQP